MASYTETFTIDNFAHQRILRDLLQINFLRKHPSITWSQLPKNV